MGGSGFDPGSAVIGNQDANVFTGTFAEAVIEEVHLHNEAIANSFDEPALALNPLAQILRVITCLSWGVSGDEGHSANLFIHMFMDVFVGLKLAVHHQKGLIGFAGTKSCTGGQQRTEHPNQQTPELA